jgi:predicted enzyme related to lactoylglutathione lyase
MLGDVVFEIYPRTAEQPATVGVRLGFRVADLDRTLTKLLGLGATVLSAAKDTEWGRRAVVADTEGHPVELTEYLA